MVLFALMSVAAITLIVLFFTRGQEVTNDGDGGDNGGDDGGDDGR